MGIQDILPTWLAMEQELETYRSGDRSMLLFSALNSSQTRSYEQAVGVLQDYLSLPDHAAQREHYRGFDGSEPRWQAPRSVETRA